MLLIHFEVFKKEKEMLIAEIVIETLVKIFGELPFIFEEKDIDKLEALANIEFDYRDHRGDYSGFNLYEELVKAIRKNGAIRLSIFMTYDDDEDTAEDEE